MSASPAGEPNPQAAATAAAQSSPSSAELRDDSQSSPSSAELHDDPQSSPSSAELHDDPQSSPSSAELHVDSRTGSADVLLRAEALRVGVRGRSILASIEFELRRGELWAVVGRNGAGKTTLLRTLLGLLPPISGAVVRAPGLGIAYVPQRFAIDPLVPCRARDLIGEGAEAGWSFLRPWRTSRQRERIAKAIEATAVRPLLSHRYGDLSEGQKQRVLLARAFAGEPDLLVLDEPTSAMDSVAEQGVVEMLGVMKRREHVGILLVTHRLGLLAGVADRVLHLDAEQGRVRPRTLAEVGL